MRYIGLFGLLAGAWCAGATQPARTPNGLLWAGTNLSLQAFASTHNGRPLSLSNQAVVTVGAIFQWRVALESEATQTVSTNEGWFTLLITNRGNAVDALNLSLISRESVDADRWSFALFEQREDGSGFSSGIYVPETTSWVWPGETRRLYLRAWPPVSRRTDGAFVNWLGTSQRDPAVRHAQEFAVGVQSNHWARTSATTPAAHQIVGEPRLIDRRLFWLTWNGQVLRLYRTPNPLSESSTFHNNIIAGARIETHPPTHNTVLIGDRWYLLTQTGRIVFFPFSLAQENIRLSAIPLSLPEGVVPEPSLPLTRVGNTLWFVDRQNRIWQHSPANPTLVQVPSLSAQPITALSSLNETMVAVGRADGRVDVYLDIAPIATNLRLPHAGRQPVRHICLQNGLITVVAGTRIGMYHLGLNKWLWTYELDSPPASRPLRDAQRGICYVLTEEGWLYAISHQQGEPLPLYPHQLFSESRVVSAVIGCIARADRGVPYLYLQAQLADGSVRSMFITAHNPLNRFVYPVVLNNAPIGTRWFFTDDAPDGLAINWVRTGAGDDGTCGAFYGFLLR
ncbi:MAG: hypothetical protein NZ874_06465 [Fimbriimonadales bacterium]|nr:hypothetical protein [Fimbriimonadales bacterium]